MDSSYVQAPHWVIAQDPVINVNLWIEILDLLEDLRATSVWVKVPSHVELEGYDWAGHLVERGRLCPPFYLMIKRPVLAPTPRCTPREA